jgi:NitT/TauT family transport system permease protein
MIRRPISRAWQVSLGVAGVLVCVLVYTAVSGYRTWKAEQQNRQNEVLPPEKRRAPIENLTIPSWKKLGGAFVSVCTPHRRTGEIPLLADSTATFMRLFVGLAVAVALSVSLGVLMGCLSPVESFCLPTLAFLAKIPPTAMMALFFVLVGIESEMYIAMLAFGTLPTLAQAVHQAARNDVPDELIHKAYTIGAHHVEVVWNVIVQQILPRVIEAVRLQVGPAMVLLIAAEYSAGAVGFGYRIRYYFLKTDMTVVFVYLIILGAAGLVIDYVLIRLRRWLCPWFGD